VREGQERGRGERKRREGEGEEQERARGKRIWAIEREREREGYSTEEEGEGGVALGVGEIGTGGKDISKLVQGMKDDRRRDPPLRLADRRLYPPLRLADRRRYPLRRLADRRRRVQNQSSAIHPQYSPRLVWSLWLRRTEQNNCDNKRIYMQRVRRESHASG